MDSDVFISVEEAHEDDVDSIPPDQGDELSGQMTRALENQEEDK